MYFLKIIEFYPRKGFYFMQMVCQYAWFKQKKKTKDNKDKEHTLEYKVRLFKFVNGYFKNWIYNWNRKERFINREEMLPDQLILPSSYQGQPSAHSDVIN